MPQVQGSNARIIYQEETTFKQDPATPNATRLWLANESVQFTKILITSETLMASRDAARPVLGNVGVTGSIKLELQANIGSIFKFALGSVNTTGTGPYTHTFKVGSSLPSFLYEKCFTEIGQYHKYNGCKINKLTLSVKPEGFQELSIDILGAKETVSTTSFDDTPNVLSFTPFTGFEASIEEGGTPIAIVTEVELSIDNDIDPNMYVIGGGGERYALPEGKVKVTGTIKALFESETLYNKAKNSTESSLKIKFTKGTGTGAAGNEYLEIYCPELIYGPNTPTISGPAGLVVELPFQAYRDDSTEATTLQIVLKNMQATV